MIEQKCISRGCEKPQGKRTRKLCSAHYMRKKRMGVYGYRDATEARTRLVAARELGWTYRQIADATGISTQRAWAIVNGKTDRVWPEVEQRCLTLRAVPASSLRGVDPTGTIRRLQALQWMGWPAKDIADRIGYKPGTIWTVKYRGGLSARFALKVAKVFDELCMTSGPSAHVAARARRCGYAPPAAWDDHTIDDPKAKPEGVRRR